MANTTTPQEEQEPNVITPDDDTQVESFFSDAETFQKGAVAVGAPIFDTLDNVEISESSLPKAEQFKETIYEDVANIDKDVADISRSKLEKNPFGIEFDPKDIVNRPEPADYIVTDLLKIKQMEEEEAKRNRTESFFISKSELANIISDNPALDVFKRDEKGKFVKLDADDANSISIEDDLVGLQDDELIEIAIPVGKKQDVPADADIEESYDYDDSHTEHSGDGEGYYITDEEAEVQRKKSSIKKTLTNVQKVIDKFGKDSYVNPDDTFRGLLQTEFKDYLVAKKISGNMDVRYSDRLVPSEMVEDSNERIEVADVSHSLLNAHKKTSILINRNDDHEIESIEVLCKCGERTVIKFDEATEETEDFATFVVESSETDVIIDPLEVLPLNYAAAQDKSIENTEGTLSEEDIEELEKPDEDDDDE